MSRLRSTLLACGLTLASCLFAFLALEAYLQITSPVELRIRGGQIELPFLKQYEIRSAPDSRLPEVALHTKNALGFRGAPPPADFDAPVTVIAVGGSTTECFALGDGLCWPALLGARLEANFDPFWINNAGIAGHTSQGHIELLNQHILALKPDAIVFLVGVNDLYFSEFTKAYDSRLTAERRGQLNRLVHRTRLWLGENSMVVALGIAAYKQWRAKQYDLTGHDRDFTTLTIGETVEADLQTEITRHRDNAFFGYESRLTQLAAMSRDAGIVPIFVTQPAVYGPFTDPRTGVDLGRIRNGVDGFDGRASWQLLELYNDVMRQVAGAEAVPLIDLAREMPKDTTFFLDQVHFTAEGSDRVAEILYPEVCRTLRAAFPQSLIRPCPGDPS